MNQSKSLLLIAISLILFAGCAHEPPAPIQSGGNMIRATPVFPDNKTIAIVGGHMTGRHIEIWDFSTHTRVKEIFSDGVKPAYGVLLADGKTLAITKGWDLELIDTSTGAAGMVPCGATGNGELTCIALTSDGKSIVAGGSDGNIYIWPGNQTIPPLETNLVSGRYTTFPRAMQVIGGDPIFALSIAPDNQSIAVSSWKLAPPLFVLDLSSGKQLAAKLSGRPANESDRLTSGRPEEGIGMINATAWTPDGKTLAVARGTGEIQLYEMPASREIHALSTTKRVNALVFIDGGRELVSAGEGRTLNVWRMDLLGQVSPAGGPSEWAIAGHTAEVTSLALTPDGKTLVSGDIEGNVRFWPVDDLINHPEKLQQSK